MENTCQIGGQLLCEPCAKSKPYYTWMSWFEIETLATNVLITVVLIKYWEQSILASDQ